MIREPKITDKARILAAAFKERGVPIAHRQALDIYAHMQGHTNWQSMQASGVTKKVTPTAPAVVVPALEDTHYVFEAMGFVRNRKVLDKLNGASVPRAPVSAVLNKLGFTELVRIELCEDDGQTNKDIKVFVVIRLKGAADLKAAKRMPHELCTALDEIAQAVCCSKSGADEVGPENWELTDEEPASEFFA